MKKVIVRSVVTVAVVAAMSAGCGKAKTGESNTAAAGEVLARVNGKVITTEEFKKEQENLPPYLKASLEDKEGKKKFLDNLVTRELILQKAKKTGLDKDASVVSKLEEVEKTLIIEALLKKEIEGKAAFTEKEAGEYYNSHKDEFKDGEKVKVSHIMVKTEKEAVDILKKLGKKERFEKLAKKYSMGPTASKGGDLGYLERGTTGVPEFEDAAFKLKKAGELSPVVSAGSAFHIIKFFERKDAEVQPFDKVKDKIITMQAKKKQKELFEAFVSSLKKEAKLEINDSLFKDEGKKEEKPAEGQKEEGVSGKKEEAHSEEKK
ncbi:MAG: Peptidylprolyl isomerase [Deltaproteobacteria bacterium]|nr:Peptidylprolyl isomerase [Deltaproteobacteria bacterium]